MGLFQSSNKNGAADKNGRRVLLQELDRLQGECYLVMRRSDMMALTAAGDLRGLTGVTLEEMQEDPTRMDEAFGDRKGPFRVYYEWSGQEPLSMEFQRRSGQWVELSLRPGELGQDVLHLTDVTEKHRLIDDYEKRLEESEKASQSKTTFLSRMSHEIRTPMNGIIGMLSLAEGKLDEGSEVMQYLKRADGLSDHLLSLINDILDMSRIEAGKVELEEKPFSLRRMGAQLQQMFAKNLEERGIRYEVRFEDMTVDAVVGDEMRIRQIIINFLSNAVKFTKEGEVTVTFRQMMLRGGKVDLMFRVHDTGIGMSPEFISRIFRPFEQENASISHNYGGTGLGMAITDQLVHLMGGQIVVESKLGKSSDFTVFLSLPVASDAELEEKPQAAQSGGTDDEHCFEGKRILLAEDNEINAMIGQEVLTGMGAEVEVAENGQLAVEHFRRNQPGYYDLILMDVQMPVMDGRAAARAIRALSRPDGKTIPIFALSADAFLEDERLSLESGMNGHFAKPVDFVALRRSVAPFLKKEES